MKEAKWLNATRPYKMLELVQYKSSPRKCRLVAVAFCRRVRPLIEDDCGLRAIDLAEHYADGFANRDDILRMHDEVSKTLTNLQSLESLTDGPARISHDRLMALLCTYYLTGEGSVSYDYLGTICKYTDVAAVSLAMRREECGEDQPACNDRFTWQSALIREIVGNPFHPVDFKPVWLTSTVLSLAEAIYTDRAFDCLPILADALQDAGCDSDDLLRHLRSDGPHVRGCWALDLVLGKA